MTLNARSIGGRRLLAAACGSLALAVAAPASGATWANGRTTPTLGQIVAIDETGEPFWPYGQEDLAGDGAATFAPAEQAVDLRTGYAAADQARLWLRGYVSDPNAAGGDVVVFVFLDRDASASTGGPANAAEIEPRLTAVPSPGGFDFVVGVRGDGTFVDLWAWDAVRQVYDPVPEARARGEAEAGRDLDPIRVGADQHGYVQASVELSAVNVAPACGANVLFRSVNGAPGGQQPAGDLDVGAFGSCVPGDADGDKVPDVAVPSGCTEDDQCPNNGVCDGGRCLIAAPCATTPECPAGRECTADGRCVAPDGGACTTNDQCDPSRVCNGATCVACTPGGSQCGAGRRCNADGTCSGAGGGGDGGPSLDPDGRVEGGAFNCSGGARGVRSGAGGAAAAFAALLCALAGQRRAARRRGGG